MNSPTPLTYPLVVIDFEASALSLDSYPIEVGLAIVLEAGGKITTWSSLIKPDPEWALDEQWDPDAERVHGIRRWDLRDGAEPNAVMAELNMRIPAGSSAWCDGGPFDAAWLHNLSAAAGQQPTFVLADVEALLGGDGDLRGRYRRHAAGSARPHRAGPDAEVICNALIQTWAATK